MKNRFYCLLILVLFSFFTFTGCSTISKYIGENKIEQGIDDYVKNGVSHRSLETLISGLDYFPESPVGIENLKVQYENFNHLKNAIYNSKNFNFENLKKIESYLVITGQITNLSKKLPLLGSVLPNFPEEKNKFSNFLNIHLKNSSISNKRKENIYLLKNYENFARFSSSLMLNNRISDLKNAVTIKYVSNLRVRPNLNRYDLKYLFKKVSHENVLFTSRDYIQFLGNLDSVNNITRDIQVLQIDIFSFDIISLNSELLENSNKDSKFFKESKTLAIRGVYKIFDTQSRFPLIGTELNTFEFKKDFSFEIEQIGNKIKKSDEKEVVEQILEDFFYRIIKNEIPYELDNYFN